METAILFGVVLAVVGVTSVIKLPWWSEKVKLTVATVVSVIGAGLYTWFVGDVDWTNFAEAALVVFGSSQLIYRFIIDHTNFDDKLEQVGVKRTYNEGDLP